MPLEALLSAAYADERRALVGERASHELRPGAPGRPRAADAAAGAGGASGARRRRADASASAGDTCHLDVADRHGNLVSATPSGGWLHGSPIVPGLGFCMGTRAQMFWLTEGLPNSLEPGKRPRTTLTPTLVLRDGEPYMAIGTPGGDMQDQWQLDAAARPPPLRPRPPGGDRRPELPLQPHAELVPSARLHLNEVEIEERAARRSTSCGGEGTTSQVRPPWSLGRVSAVAREPDGC